MSENVLFCRNRGWNNLLNTTTTYIIRIDFNIILKMDFKPNSTLQNWLVTMRLYPLIYIELTLFLIDMELPTDLYLLKSARI